MRNRIDLHQDLIAILGNNNVFFQPPPSILLRYPCIIYRMTGIKPTKADDILYKAEKKYTVTLIHEDPDNLIVDELINYPYASFDRFYTKDNLNHYVFTIYY